MPSKNCTEKSDSESLKFSICNPPAVSGFSPGGRGLRLKPSN